MNRPTETSASLRVLEQEAERMARLSPFAADRDRFNRIALRYREEAARRDKEAPPPSS